MNRTSSAGNSRPNAVTTEVLLLPQRRSRQRTMSPTVTRVHRHQPRQLSNPQQPPPTAADRLFEASDNSPSGSVVSRKGPGSVSGVFDQTLNRSSRTRAAVNDYREIPKSPVSVAHEIVLADLHRSVPAASPAQKCDVIVHVDPTRTQVPISIIASPPLPTKIDKRDVSRSPRQQKQSTQCANEPTDLPTTIPEDSTFTCPRCGGCRCAKCNPFDGSESAQSCCCVETAQCLRVVDVVSCVCCVDRLCCHLTNGCHRSSGGTDDVDESAVPDNEHQCDCSSDSCGVGCCCRWTMMVALSACLPCLCLYWPLRCVVGGWSKFQSFCRNECCRRPGCRCPRPYMAPSQPPTLHQPLLSQQKSSAKGTCGPSMLDDPKGTFSAGNCAAIVDQLSRKLDPNS